MNKKLTLDNGDLLPEYDLDYTKAKPNHYAARRYNERKKPLSETNPYLCDSERNLMTVTLDLSPLVAGRVRALAHAQNRPMADVLNDAVTELYTGDAQAAYYLPDPSEGAPSTVADARAVQEAFQDFDAGDRGTSPAESFAKLAAKYNFKNPVL